MTQFLTFSNFAFYFGCNLQIYSKWVGSHTVRQNNKEEGLSNSDSKVYALRSFQFLIDKPSSFCPLQIRLLDGNNQCVGANSVAKGGQRVITGYFCGFLPLLNQGYFGL